MCAADEWNGDDIERHVAAISSSSFIMYLANGDKVRGKGGGGKE